MGFFGSSSFSVVNDNAHNRLAKCGGCGLSSRCFTPRMPPTGKGRKKILFIAEAPGELEDKKGVQLIGPAGKLLRDVLKDLGEELDDCWKTNCVICRPPANEIKDEHIEACRPNIFKTIKELQPTVIVLLGFSAVKSVLHYDWFKKFGSGESKDQALTTWLGWNIPLARFGAWVVPTYHPSFILRKDEDITLMKIFKQHLARAFELERCSRPSVDSLDELRGSIEVIKSTRLASERIEELSKKKGRMAFDYETTGLKPDSDAQQIVSCSFCFEGSDTFACKITPELLGPLRMVLRNPELKKVASNLKFEERWTIAKLKTKVKGWWWDTMLAAHVLDNRSGITSVKFQAFVLLGIGDYDSHISPFLKSSNTNGINRIKELDTHELLIYNGMDSLAEYKVMEHQRKRMGLDG